MRPNRMMVGGALALVLAAGLGFGAARFFPAAPKTPEAEQGEEHADESQGEGLVRLSAAQRQSAGVVVTTLTAGGGAETRVSGRVEAHPSARAAVAATVSGRIERVLIAAGSPVRRGQALAILVSGEAATLRADAAAADAAAGAASAAFARETRLLDAGVVARQDWEASRAQSQSAAAQAQAARARASAAGSPSASGRATVTSPVSGVVTSVSATPGSVLAAGHLIAEVTDPTNAEIVFSAPADVAALVRSGSVIAVEALSGETFEAEVTAVAPASGTSSAATIRARGRGAHPPIGSAVTARLVTGAVQGFTAPSEAVQTVEGRTVVFVETQQGFRAVPVVIGRQAGGRTEILRGLTGTERIASTNAFLLKAELAKGEAEHGH